MIRLSPQLLRGLLLVCGSALLELPFVLFFSYGV
jgi:hypothetical protein